MVEETKELYTIIEDEKKAVEIEEVSQNILHHH